MALYKVVVFVLTNQILRANSRHMAGASVNENLHVFEDNTDDTTDTYWLDSMTWKKDAVRKHMVGPKTPNYCSVCTCSQYNERLYVDCTDKGLENAFDDISRKTVDLDYTRNYISNVVYDNFRGLTLLKVLKLSYNKIRQIAKDAFRDLTSLTDLYIDNNNIITLQIGIPEGTFDSLINLRLLVMHGNVYVYISDASRLNGRTFQPLKNLKFLVIDGFRKLKFDYHFLNTRLSSLILKGPPCGCLLNVVDDDIFDGLLHLQNLSMRHCNISSLSPVALSRLKSLRYLDISKNYHLGMQHVLGPIAKALMDSNIKILKMNLVSDPYQVGNRLDNENLFYINQLNLTELYMDSNSIEIIDFHNPLFSKYSTLKVLSLK
ncbi:biglycan-like [Dreissena polymorpha]|uniref:Uncharacterized protein n=1 Tax=Dreissena polymorpha TaxID=45954 RepID=A0A9D4R9J2_DREPO|nr:biglycan-like [Dreissena polymorpha]KAH3858692.1 hypothetical protein DPMN_101318 [Dreissena polymorpha]